MPDQAGGRLGTESLANEQGTQRSRSIFNNTASGKLMDPWKKNMMSFLARKSPITQQPRPVAPNQTSKTLYGAADPNVEGGTKEVQTMHQQMAQQGAASAAPSQPIANPAAPQHNPPKEASMNTERQHRIETVRAILKFAACMKKGLGKKKLLKKLGESEKKKDVPRTSAAGPLGAAGIGAGGGVASGALQPALRRFAARSMEGDDVNMAAFQRQIDEPGQMKALLKELAEEGAGKGEQLAAEAIMPQVQHALSQHGKLYRYGVLPAAGAAAVGFPTWMGARAAKHKGGAGRGAAAGAGVGAATTGTLGLLHTLLNKYPGKWKSLGLLAPLLLGGGAGGGAVLGAIGGGIQKRRRTKAQEKKKKPEKKEKSEKNGSFRKRAVAGPPGAAGIPWAKILAYSGLGAGALGALGLGSAIVPPVLRGIGHKFSYDWDPMYRMQFETQRVLNNPQLAMLHALRSLNAGYGGGGIPPMLAPEDRQMMQQATYLQGLRARTRALREALEA